MVWFRFGTLLLKSQMKNYVSIKITKEMNNPKPKFPLTNSIKDLSIDVARVITIVNHT